MADRIQLRGDTKRNWMNVNPILAINEMAIERSGLFANIKLGDGATNYENLPYLGMGDSGDTSSNIVIHNLDPDAHLTKFNSKLDLYSAIPLIKNVEYDRLTKSMIFTRFDNTIITMELLMDAIISEGFFDSISQEIVFVLASGDEVRVPITGLLLSYVGEDTDTIQMNISLDNIITAHIIGGSVSKILLSLELQTLLNELEEKSHYHINKDILDKVVQPIKKYSFTFNSSTSWEYTNPYTIIIPESEHELGENFISDLYILNNSTYKKFDNYTSDGYWLSIDTSGNLTINAIVPFAGKVVLIG